MNLNQVTVPVTDLERLIVFYKKLGLTMIVYAEHGYARFECPGGATLSLQTTETPLADYPLTVYFEIDDLDNQVRTLEAKGLKFEHGPVDQSWLWREAHLRDPDGNHLCLYYAGENRRNPPWRNDGVN